MALTVLAGLSLLVPVGVFGADAPAPNTEVNSLVDLSNWAFEKQGPFFLRKGWTVFRGQILDPYALKNAACGWNDDQKAGEPVTVPDLWGPAYTASVSTGHGQATYCTEILLPTRDSFYAIRMGTLRSVAAVFAVYREKDGMKKVALLQRNGNLHAGGAVNNPAVPIIALPHGVSRMTIIMQLRNDIHKQGGIVEVPIVDLKWRLVARENRETALPSALVIVLVLVGFAALIVGSRITGPGTGNAYEHRAFALLAFAAAFRALFVSDIVWDYFPAFSLARKYDFEYLSLFLIAIAYYGFIHLLLRPKKFLKIDYLVYGGTGALAIFALFFAPYFPAGTITLTREAFQLVWAVIVVMVLITVLKTTIQNPEQRKEALVVSLAGLTYASYEILAAVGIISLSMEWSQFVVFAVLLMHAQAFVIKAKRIESERDDLTGRLQTLNADLQNRAIALDLALTKAEEASKAKSNFLATISHELRTPLNAIIGFSELMQRELFGALGSSYYKEYAIDINNSGQHLLSLVDDILDLSIIEEGADQLNEETVDLKDEIEAVFRLLATLAERKKIKCRLDASVRSFKLRADKRKIRQVLINLINNAVKFSDVKSTVTVQVRTNADCLCIDVIDTGIGIRSEDIPLIFSRFGQADNTRWGSKSGVGIGLPLSEALIKQHGGELILTSKFGEGTSVTIRFPADRTIAG